MAGLHTQTHEKKEREYTVYGDNFLQRVSLRLVAVCGERVDGGKCVREGIPVKEKEESS